MESLRKLIEKYGLVGTVLILIGSILIIVVSQGCGHFHLKATDLELQSKQPVIQQTIEQNE